MRYKKLLFYCIMIGFVCLVTDIACYALLGRINQQHNLFYNYTLPTNEDITKLYNHTFHSKWGWDIWPKDKGILGERQHQQKIIKPIYKIKTFGDSFTYGANVKSHETWQANIEKQTNWDCLNFGVGGFGTGQALLKYKDNTIKSKYTILGIMDENINRVLTGNWLFYQKTFAPKPHFRMKNGIIKFIRNPADDLESLKQFTNPQYVASLAKEDYWVNYHQKLNFPTKQYWPATITIFKHFDFFMYTGKMQINKLLNPTFENLKETKKAYHLYEEHSEGLGIMMHIIDEFKKTANQRKEIPIIVLFPLKTTLDIYQNTNKKTYQNLLDHIHQQQLHVVDLSDIFKSEAISKLYIPNDGHLTPYGNEIAGTEVKNYVSLLDQQ